MITGNENFNSNLLQIAVAAKSAITMAKNWNIVDARMLFFIFQRKKNMSKQPCEHRHDPARMENKVEHVEKFVNQMIQEAKLTRLEEEANEMHHIPRNALRAFIRLQRHNFTQIMEMSETTDFSNPSPTYLNLSLMHEFMENIFRMFERAPWIEREERNRRRAENRKRKINKISSSE